MKLAIAGKGGVGKTTLAALLAHAFAERGHTVLAVDADPSPGLGAALGFPPDLLARITPIAELGDLIEERTGAKPGTAGGYFRLNPRVNDIPARFAVEHDGVRLLELGAATAGGAGCICPESALLKALVGHLVLYEKEIVILDMYAGVEHLGRATASGVEAMIIVVEPGQRSLTTAAQIARMARDIGLRRLALVANKMRGAADRAFVESRAEGLPLVGVLPYTTSALDADRERTSVFHASPELAQAGREIAAAVAEFLLENTPPIATAAR